MKENLFVLLSIFIGNVFVINTTLPPFIIGYSLIATPYPPAGGEDGFDIAYSLRSLDIQPVTKIVYKTYGSVIVFPSNTLLGSSVSVATNVTEPDSVVAPGFVTAV